MTHDDLIKRLCVEMQEFSSYLITYRYPETPADSRTDSDNAIEDATGETGCVLPITDQASAFWFRQRVKRHLYWFLLNGTMMKYQAKVFSPNQQFDHLKAIIAQMDQDWTAYSQSVGIFDDGTSRFGDVMPTGFRYDRLGRAY